MPNQQLDEHFKSARSHYRILLVVILTTILFASRPNDTKQVNEALNVLDVLEGSQKMFSEFTVATVSFERLELKRLTDVSLRTHLENTSISAPEIALEFEPVERFVFSHVTEHGSKPSVQMLTDYVEYSDFRVIFNLPDTAHIANELLAEFSKLPPLQIEKIRFERTPWEPIKYTATLSQLHDSETIIFVSTCSTITSQKDAAIGSKFIVWNQDASGNTLPPTQLDTSPLRSLKDWPILSRESLDDAFKRIVTRKNEQESNVLVFGIGIPTEVLIVIAPFFVAYFLLNILLHVRHISARVQRTPKKNELSYPWIPLYDDRASIAISSLLLLVSPLVSSVWMVINTWNSASTWSRAFAVLMCLVVVFVQFSLNKEIRVLRSKLN